MQQCMCDVNWDRKCSYIIMFSGPRQGCTGDQDLDDLHQKYAIDQQSSVGCGLLQ